MLQTKLLSINCDSESSVIILKVEKRKLVIQFLIHSGVCESASLEVVRELKSKKCAMAWICRLQERLLFASLSHYFTVHL